YSHTEHEVWTELYGRQLRSVQQYAADIYLKGLASLDIPETRIPQCCEINLHLTPLTGWSVQPVPALISFERFFTMLSEKKFPAASFIRSRGDFDYIQEPDIFHEIFGHTPLLADPQIAQFSQTIGAIGRQADPKDYGWIIRLYWFTIEFGLFQQGNDYKAIGSGLNSSPTELIYAVNSNIPERRPFNVVDILRTPYRIDIHQPIYYVLENIDDLFGITETSLMASLTTAQGLGLYSPKYPKPMNGTNNN
ncbi:phenylalanine 4-monooxygenase, partial [Porticoccaceae bacterium]|nr:phenylalanine 4-monooxygenase [Porticoccaceae bacterium]